MKTEKTMPLLLKRPISPIILYAAVILTTLLAVGMIQFILKRQEHQSLGQQVGNPFHNLAIENFKLTFEPIYPPIGYDLSGKIVDANTIDPVFEDRSVYHGKYDLRKDVGDTSGAAFVSRLKNGGIKFKFPITELKTRDSFDSKNKLHLLLATTYGEGDSSALPSDDDLQNNADLEAAIRIRDNGRSAEFFITYKIRRLIRETSKDKAGYWATVLYEDKHFVVPAAIARKSLAANLQDEADEIVGLFNGTRGRDLF